MPRPKLVPISKKNPTTQTFYLYAQQDAEEDAQPEVSAQEWAGEAELAAELGLARRASRRCD